MFPWEMEESFEHWQLSCAKKERKDPNKFNFLCKWNFKQNPKYPRAKTFNRRFLAAQSQFP